MIVKPKQNWFQLLFIWDGSVLQSIIPQPVLMALVSTLAVVTQGRIFGEKIPLNATLLTLFGLTLAIFIGFRSTASCDRFKEGRLLWGNAPMLDAIARGIERSVFELCGRDVPEPMPLKDGFLMT